MAAAEQRELKYIKAVKLHNFKRFQNLYVSLDADINILIGDNESGKSTILEAIDLVLSGSFYKIDIAGIDKLFNLDAIKRFRESEQKSVSSLPEMYVEVYFSGCKGEVLDGKQNSRNKEDFGLRLRVSCEDVDEEVQSLIQASDEFPFDYYRPAFKTFSGAAYNSYSRPLKHLLFDNTRTNYAQAADEFTSKLYDANINNIDRAENRAAYRSMKSRFKNEKLNKVNAKIASRNLALGLKTTQKYNLESSLTVIENEINIENKGMGRRVLMKTELINSMHDIDVLMFEEPENHLSYLNTNKMLDNLRDNANKQLLLSTHSSLVSTRLDLRKCIMIDRDTNKPRQNPLRLQELAKSTANYFMKLPPTNILEFILAKSVLLVEGASEYILLEKLFESCTGKRPITDGIHIISVGGKAFRRYLEVAQILNIKSAVITDNDKEPEISARQYPEFQGKLAKVFCDKDKDAHTFELSIWKYNQELCGKVFKVEDVKSYMLKNKADSALKLLQSEERIVVPEYIKEAIQWIGQKDSS